MNLWKPDGWVMTVSGSDEFVSEDWSSFLVVRWTVFGEWMTSGLVGTVDSGADGSTLFCQSCLAGWRHRLHLFDILSLKEGCMEGVVI